MSRTRRTSVLLTAALWFAFTGCTSPEAINKFCTASNATLSAAEPVFQDLEASCLREVNLRKDIGTFASVQSDPGCDAIGKQADGAVAAAEILSDYFDAIGSVASFGTAKTASNAGALASQTANAVGAGSLAQQALGSMAQFLTSGVTGGYQQRLLSKDLVEVSNNIGVVTDALAMIVQRNYIDQALKSEDQKLVTHYRDFLSAHPEGIVVLELDNRWRTDRNVIATKRASAAQLIVALHAIKKGAAGLAERSRSLKGKEVPGLLDPYTTQLETLIPQIQKAF